MTVDFLYEDTEAELVRLRAELHQARVAADSFSELADRYKQERDDLLKNESKAARSARSHAEENKTLQAEVELLRDTNDMLSRKLATLEGLAESVDVLAESKIRQRVADLILRNEKLEAQLAETKHLLEGQKHTVQQLKANALAHTLKVPPEQVARIMSESRKTAESLTKLHALIQGQDLDAA